MSDWESEEIAALMVKLQNSESVLTPAEEYRANSFAMLQINQAISLNLNYEGGFIPEEVLNRNIGGSQNFLLSLPGLAPFLRQGVEQLGLTTVVYGENGGPVMRNLGATIIRLEQIGVGSE